MKRQFQNLCFCRILAFIEFLYGSYQKSKEMGSTWVEEMREELKFAMICHGNTKVRRFSRQDILEKNVLTISKSMIH